MVQEQQRWARDGDAERRERLRYRFLERLYMLTGPDCGAVAHDWQIEQELGFSLDGLASVAGELERLGYLTRLAEGTRVCITDRGVQYLVKGAWRRRSIRN